MKWFDKADDRNLEILRAAFYFFCDQLDIDSEAVKAETTNECLGKDVFGTCIARFKKGQPVSLKVLVKKDLGVFSMISTLAHEMVHAKQYLDGRLKYELKIKWFCYIIPYLDLVTTFNDVSMKSVSYLDRPYEQEAFENESKLTYAFIKHIIETKEISICQILE